MPQKKPFRVGDHVVEGVYVAFLALCVITVALYALRHAPADWTLFGVSVREIGTSGHVALNHTYRWIEDSFFACVDAVLLLLTLFGVWLLITKRPIPFLRSVAVHGFVRKPLPRVALILLLAYFATGRFQQLMIGWWLLTPLASEYNIVREEYGERCTVRVQDDQFGGGPYESDWSKAPLLCRRLASQARTEYPKPAWFFGRGPDWREGD